MVIRVIGVTALICSSGVALSIVTSFSKRTDYREGVARIASVAGAYSTNKSEKLKVVWIQAYDKSGKLASGSSGHLNRDTHTWYAAVGDDRIYSYDIKFLIAYRGKEIVHRSQRYIWGK